MTRFFAAAAAVLLALPANAAEKKSKPPPPPPEMPLPPLPLPEAPAQKPAESKPDLLPPAARPTRTGVQVSGDLDPASASRLAASLRSIAALAPVAQEPAALPDKPCEIDACLAALGAAAKVDQVLTARVSGGVLRVRRLEIPSEKAAGEASNPAAQFWRAGDKATGPIIIDVNQVHPLTQLVQMGNIKILNCTSVKGPPGTVTLIDSDEGPLYAVGPRAGYEDAVLGFFLYRTADGESDKHNTDWFRKRSFPVFVMNALKYLGGVRSSLAAPNILPGLRIASRARLQCRV